MFSSVLLFLNIGGPEMILIVFVALLLFGGEKLPEIARGLGKGIRDFKDASEGVKREITNQINSYEDRKAEETAVNATPVPEAPHELPAVEGHLSLEQHEVTGNEHDLAQPVTETHGVANTLPFVENHELVSDNHITESHSEISDKTADTKTEPAKITHE
ncbi:MAG: twin-arginine translocase TatA/TatE family subunit [Mucilaginibacter sp.]|nr:twin-arginine translocase TatA/TatE family subunit [Mucilaginibacter sp.]